MYNTSHSYTEIIMTVKSINCYFNVFLKYIFYGGLVEKCCFILSKVEVKDRFENNISLGANSVQKVNFKTNTNFSAIRVEAKICFYF